MELRHLRYFLAVSEELHFSRAARRLHISQPPLSQQIRQLEAELHLRLFHRTKRKVQLTDAGRVFVGEARAILLQVEHAAQMATEASRSQLCRMVVGCSPANTNVVIRTLRAFSKRCPKVHIVFKSQTTPQQIEALSNGSIDDGFLTLPADREGLVVETLLRERLLVAMPVKHPLASRRRLALRELANETLIIFPLQMSPGRYQVISNMCRRAGMSLHVIHEVDNIYTMLQLVRSGFGVSLMRASVKEIQERGVVFRELHNSPLVETGVAYRRENRLEILPLFVEVAKKVASLYGSTDSAPIRAGRIVGAKTLRPLSRHAISSDHEGRIPLNQL